MTSECVMIQSHNTGKKSWPGGTLSPNSFFGGERYRHLQNLKANSKRLRNQPDMSAGLTLFEALIGGSPAAPDRTNGAHKDIPHNQLKSDQ